MYLDVADRAATDLTFVIKQLKEEMYSCLDRFDVVTNLNRNSVRNDLQDNLENISNWSQIFNTRAAIDTPHGNLAIKRNEENAEHKDFRA